ncbi:hypothetical protein ANO11243_089690 [Dothideomycetidae sp. 11243]|nr:hypothetical protein ANO11243_089690 [fungal sp. No.11243]
MAWDVGSLKRSATRDDLQDDSRDDSRNVLRHSVCLMVMMPLLLLLLLLPLHFFVLLPLRWQHLPADGGPIESRSSMTMEWNWKAASFPVCPATRTRAPASSAGLPPFHHPSSRSFTWRSGSYDPGLPEFFGRWRQSQRPHRPCRASGTRAGWRHLAAGCWLLRLGAASFLGSFWLSRALQ